MKILIWTDLEGVSGIVDFDSHDQFSEKNKFFYELMTGEINAAIRACFDNGATDVKIIEGHDAIDIRTMDERATLVPARYPAVMQLQGWEGYDYMLLIGCHSMAGTKDGVLCHTGNRQVEHRKINDLKVGEIGTTIFQAGELDIPVIMISGDFAACREAKELSENIHTASVKKGYDLHHAECLHPKKAQKLIYDTVTEAIKKRYLIKPIKVEGEITFEERFKTTDNLKNRTPEKYAEIIDEYTIRYYGSTLNRAYGRRCKLNIEEY